MVRDSIPGVMALMVGALGGDAKQNGSLSCSRSLMETFRNPSGIQPVNRFPLRYKDCR